MNSPSNSIIQELIAPQVPFEPSDIKTVCTVEPIQTRQLNEEADFIALVLGAVAIDWFPSHCGRSVD
jgi:hypothetical protein